MNKSGDAGVRPRVVVVGCGFAGLQVARGLRKARCSVIVVDRRNFTLFQPLLYQVATGLLSPANIATPLRPLFSKQLNAVVVLGEAAGFDLIAKNLLLSDGVVAYDHLVIACGARHHYFGHPQWEARAPGLKSLEDAEDIRGRIFLALERADREPDSVARQRQLCFVIVGGGPTSVELAGAVAEIASRVSTAGYHELAHERARILLVEADGSLLSSFSTASSQEALRALRQLGIDVRLSTRLIEVTEQGVVLEANGQREEIAAATILWGAGVRATPLAARLAAASGISPGPGGRIPIQGDCSLAGHPEIFVLGDMAHALQQDRPLPGTAQVAVQQGDYVARVLTAQIAGRPPPPPFSYHQRGNMATIGKRLAVADIGRWHLRGRSAWLTWLGLHLIKLINFENRLLVLIQWAWAYVHWNRSASLVTGNDPDRQSKPHADHSEKIKPGGLTSEKP